MTMWSGRASARICPTCNSNGFRNFTCAMCCKEMLLRNEISMEDYDALTGGDGPMAELREGNPYPRKDAPHVADNTSATYPDKSNDDASDARDTCKILARQLGVAHARLRVLEATLIQLLELMGSDDGRIIG